MTSSKNHPMNGIVEVDEMVVGQREEGVKGREKSKKKLVIIGIEKKGKGVSRMYARVIDRASEKEFTPFFEDHIDQNAKIRTDGWRSYTSLKSKYPNLKQELSGKKGDNFSDIHRCIMMFKSWLRGMHHSVRYLQDYLDEYTYRFNRSFMKGNIFDNLLTKAMNHPPVMTKPNRLSA